MHGNERELLCMKCFKLIKENTEGKLHNITLSRRLGINSGRQRIISELPKLQWVAPNPHWQRWPWVNPVGQKTKQIDRTIK